MHEIKYFSIFLPLKHNSIIQCLHCRRWKRRIYVILHNQCRYAKLCHIQATLAETHQIARITEIHLRWQNILQHAELLKNVVRAQGKSICNHYSNFAKLKAFHEKRARIYGANHLTAKIY